MVGDPFLDDPKMRELVSARRPDLGWRPALITADGSTVRVTTGPLLGIRLAIGVGPRRAARIARLVRTDLARKEGLDRRTVLKGIGLGAIASIVGIGAAGTASAGEPAARRLANHELDDAVRKTRSTKAVEGAEERIAHAGFKAQPDNSVGFLGDDGTILLMLFYADAAGRADRAAGLVREVAADGTTRLVVEELEGRPEDLLAGGVLHPEALTTTSIALAPSSEVAPQGASEYFNCMLNCLGDSDCASDLDGCRSIPVLAVMILCIAGFCGLKAWSCHNNDPWKCKTRW